MDTFGISFNNLYTMTNIPVKRFADFLHRRGELEEYMDLLVRNFNLDTTENLMCMETVSVGWDGKIYDCDFNQQLGFGIGSDVSKGQVRVVGSRLGIREHYNPLPTHTPFPP